ncbi:MAG: efflux RND transporter permease subunit [Planctomycetaceae bacterium]|nr:efflux RND transporter permease subunit [Planctomycetaceae bacterium]
MFLVRFALRNSYAVVALAIGLCLLGAAVVPLFPIDILPDFKKPVVVSYFSYPGLPTGEMEKSVTSRVERALTLAGRIEHQESRTMPGGAMIKIFFQPGTNPSSAMNDIVNLEASDMFHLPPGMEFPFTLRSEPANLPVVLAAISGEGLSEKELYTIGYYAVRNKMGGLKGVQIPHPFGGKFRQMMIYVDPLKLQSFGLSARDVVTALRDSNLVMAAGAVKLGEAEYQVHPINTLLTTDDIDSVPIAVRDGRPIFIRDVGYAKDDAALQYNIVRVNGSRSVYCPLLREPGENTIACVDRIYEGIATEIPKMKERGDIPDAAEVALVSDQSSYIRNAMRNLMYEVGLGGLLVAIVVIAFLRQIKPALIVVATILLSILVGALAFFFTGQTLNVMTLGGIALAVGTVVDAGIVIVENIVRHLRMGKTSVDAARDGANEVAGAVLAGTVTTLAVFVPVVFLTGMIRFLFEPLSAAATMTIGASYFVAMTVVPAYCARFLKRRPDSHSALDSPAREQSEGRTESPSYEEPRGLYAGTLAVILKMRWLVVLVTLVLVGASVLLLPRIGTELFPSVDAGSFEVRLKTIPGTRLEDTETLVAKIEDTIKEVIPADEIDAIISNIGLPVGKGAGFSTILSPNSGPDTAFLVVNLAQRGRSTSSDEYVGRLRALFAERFPREQFLFTSGSIVNAALNEGAPTPINVQVSAGSLEQCRVAAERIAELVSQIPGTADVQIAQALDYPQLDIKVDRTKARFLGLSQEDVAQSILTAYGSSIAYSSTIWVDPGGTDFFMGVQYENNELSSLDDLRNLPLSIDGPNGPVTVPLSNVATINRVNIPGEIKHYNIARVNDVYVNVVGRDVGSVAADVERVIANMEANKEFEPGVAAVLSGPVTTMKSSAKSLGIGIGVAIILVYLVMLAQFKSFVDPLIIMLAVPLGLSGVLAMLYLTNTTLNIQSLMGTLMMIGVVVNNSILLVEFANQLRERGYDVRDAALTAASVRLRPILMTSLTLVASMAPLSIHLAPGGEAMIPLARAMIGGMVVSTVLTLFLVPCVYTIVKRVASPATA